MAFGDSNNSTTITKTTKKDDGGTVQVNIPKKDIDLSVDIDPKAEETFARSLIEARVNAKKTKKISNDDDSSLFNELRQNELDVVDDDNIYSENEGEYNLSQRQNLSGRRNLDNRLNATISGSDQEEGGDTFAGFADNITPSGGSSQKTAKQSSNSGGANKKDSENFLAQRLRQQRESRRSAYRQSLKIKNFSKGNKFRKLKRLKNLVRAIKVAALSGTALGDIIVSFTIFFLTLNLEAIYHYINKNWPFDALDKAMLIAGWLIFFIILFLIFLLVYILVIIPQTAT